MASSTSAFCPEHLLTCAGSVAVLAFDVRAIMSSSALEALRMCWCAVAAPDVPPISSRDDDATAATRSGRNHREPGAEVRMLCTVAEFCIVFAPPNPTLWRRSVRTPNGGATVTSRDQLRERE